MFRRSSYAFSLLETIIASFVFITTVAGVLSVWTAHARGIAKARMVLIANELSEQVMEECVAARFERVDSFDGVEESYKVKFIIKDREIESVFRSKVSVTADPTSPRIRLVKVRVDWHDSTGDSKIELNTELHSSA